MMPSRRIPVLFRVLALFLAAAGASPAPTDAETFGKSLEVTAIDGAELTIPAPDKEATVLLFLSTDCPIANKYAPAIRRIQEQFEEENVVFLRIYDDTYQDAADLREHTEEYDYAMPAILDSAQQIIQRSGATITPEAVVLNQEGLIVYRGRIDDRFIDFGRYRQHAQSHDLINALTATLQGEAPPTPRTKAIGCFIPKPRNTEN